MDISDLSAQMRTCSICADLPLGPRPLFQLHSEVRILIAGQAPGRKTHQMGRPFDDVSGDRLRGWMGIDRDAFYDNPKIGILPMGLCYPGTGSQGDLPPRVECAAAWHGKVLPLLTKLDLMLVIGRYAIDWHLPALKGARVTDAVQSWESCLPSTLVLPHPSPRNNRWLAQNPWFNETIVPRLKDRVEQIMG